MYHQSVTWNINATLLLHSIYSMQCHPLHFFKPIVMYLFDNKMKVHLCDCYSGRNYLNLILLCTNYLQHKVIQLTFMKPYLQVEE